MEQRYTKGPWGMHRAYINNEPIAVVRPNGSVFVGYTAVISAGNKIIGNATLTAAADGGGFPTVDNLIECKANANLFIAAPDMYEAIKAYLECDSMTSSGRELHVEAFCAAIAKAEATEF